LKQTPEHQALEKSPGQIAGIHVSYIHIFVWALQNHYRNKSKLIHITAQNANTRNGWSNIEMEGYDMKTDPRIPAYICLQI
jgi:hypothetical protein